MSCQSVWVVVWIENYCGIQGAARMRRGVVIVRRTRREGREREQRGKQEKVRKGKDRTGRRLLSLNRRHLSFFSPAHLLCRFLFGVGRKQLQPPEKEKGEGENPAHCRRSFPTVCHSVWRRRRCLLCVPRRADRGRDLVGMGRRGGRGRRSFWLQFPTSRERGGGKRSCLRARRKEGEQAERRGEERGSPSTQK